MITTPNNDIKKLMKFLFIIFVLAISIKIIYVFLGHAIIKAIYDGELIGYLNNIIRGQSKHSLEYYNTIADKLVTEILIISSINVSILACFLFLPPVILSKWSSGQKWLENHTNNIDSLSNGEASEASVKAITAVESPPRTKFTV